jgi:hypothetical protein
MKIAMYLISGVLAVAGVAQINFGSGLFGVILLVCALVCFYASEDWGK